MGNYVGEAVKRREDPRFITGKGKYVANVSLPNMVHLAIKRSPYGHAKIKSISIKKAAAMDGVVAVFTGQDLIDGGCGALPCGWNVPDIKVPTRHALTVDKARHVGDAVAVVAAAFGVIGSPLTALRDAGKERRLVILALGLSLAVMNSAFYLALERLPMSLVASMEFVATTALSLLGVRTARNALALATTVGGVMLLMDPRWAADVVGLAWAGLNAVLFAVYVVLSHRLSRSGTEEGVAGLGAAMVVAAVFAAPIGLLDAGEAFADPRLLLAGVGVGVCSSVIPYLCDQMALSRLPRASFALMLALLPATAALVGALVLGQWPSLRDIAGVGLVMAGVFLHRARDV